MNTISRRKLLYGKILYFKIVKRELRDRYKSVNYEQIILSSFMVVTTSLTANVYSYDAQI